MRTARVPRLYPCRYAREKLSVRESDRRCSPLAFCPRRISVGRAHHYRKGMYSIRRFRTKLTFRRIILHEYMYIRNAHARSTCAYIRTYVHIHTHIHAYTCTCIRIHAHTSAHTYTFTRTYMHIHTHIKIIYMYIHPHT